MQSMNMQKSNEKNTLRGCLSNDFIDSGLLRNIDWYDEMEETIRYGTSYSGPKPK